MQRCWLTILMSRIVSDSIAMVCQDREYVSLTSITSRLPWTPMDLAIKYSEMSSFVEHRTIDFVVDRLIAVECLRFPTFIVDHIPLLSSRRVSDQDCFWRKKSFALTWGILFVSLGFDTQNSAPPMKLGQRRQLCWTDCQQMVLAAFARQQRSRIQTKQTSHPIGYAASFLSLLGSMLCVLQVTKRRYRPLKYQCVLFARKFPAKAARQTLRAALACKGGSLGYWC